MNYTTLLNELKQASLFDLYRCHVAIGNELDNPKRLLAIKQKLQIGMTLSYFDPIENRSHNVTVLELKRNKVVVLACETQQRFLIPYYMLNIDGVDTDIYETHKKENLTINTLKIGDCLGFTKDNKTIVGTVKRLNQKTVTLVTQSGFQWRVSYSLLYRIHDAEVNRDMLIEQIR